MAKASRSRRKSRVDVPSSPRLAAASRPFTINQKIIVNVKSGHKNSVRKGHRAVIKDYSCTTQETHIWYEGSGDIAYLKLHETKFDWIIEPPIGLREMLREQNNREPTNRELIEWRPPKWVTQRSAMAKVVNEMDGNSYVAVIDGYDPISRRCHINYGEGSEWAWALSDKVVEWTGAVHDLIPRHSLAEKPPPFDVVAYNLPPEFIERSKTLPEFSPSLVAAIVPPKINLPTLTLPTDQSTALPKSKSKSKHKSKNRSAVDMPSQSHTRKRSSQPTVIPLPTSSSSSSRRKRRKDELSSSDDEGNVVSTSNRRHNSSTLMPARKRQKTNKTARKSTLIDPRTETRNIIARQQGFEMRTMHSTLPTMPSFESNPNPGFHSTPMAVETERNAPTEGKQESKRRRRYPIEATIRSTDGRIHKWVRRFSKADKKYFYRTNQSNDTSTEDVSWNPWRLVDQKAPWQKHLHYWDRFADVNGRAYYHNYRTGVTDRNRPLEYESCDEIECDSDSDHSNDSE